MKTGTENNKQAAPCPHCGVRDSEPAPKVIKARFQGKIVTPAPSPPELKSLEMKWAEAIVLPELKRHAVYGWIGYGQISGGQDPKVALPYTRVWVSAGIVLAKRLFQFEARGVPTTAGISPLRSLNSCLKVATHSRPCPLNNIQYQHIRTEYMLWASQTKG